ncbi:MAG: delta-60 repeat domain-containing protein [Prevotellaceae bacterium]|nr:delta-60 repeat domain-containing protein [Prevotella sp.]MDD7258000.1 delta-60 repeat domain-containing protein [Prevotellaceae bacterium]MDY6131722.1 delta-60 repeat domain-containing protein [Prevotella sp.]
MNKILLKWIMVATLFALPSAACAQLNPGDVDKAYTPHFDGNILSVELQEDGKHVFAGTFSHVGDRTVGGLVRLNEDGTPDKTFNEGGSGFDNYATAMAQTADGKFIVAGLFSKYNGQPVGMLVRINADGTLDESFNGNNKFTLEGSAFTDEVQLQHIAVLPNGQFYVAGGFNRVNGKPAPLIARFNADGTHDESYLPTKEEIHLKTSPYVDGFYMDTDGSVYLGGAFGAYGGKFSNKRMVHITSDGKLDVNFLQPGFDGYVKSIAPFGNDGLIVGGDFVEVDAGSRFLTCVINKNGSLREDYDPLQFAFTDYPEDESLAVFSAQLVGENVIVAGGDVSIPPHSFVYVLDKDGENISDAYNFGGGPNSLVTYMKVDEKNGFAYLSGFFTQFNSISASYFARVAVPKSAPSAIQGIDNGNRLFSANYRKGTLSLNSTEKLADVRVVDIMGRSIAEAKFLNSSKLSMPLANGMYVVIAKGISGKTYIAKTVVRN